MMVPIRQAVRLNVCPYAEYRIQDTGYARAVPSHFDIAIMSCECIKCIYRGMKNLSLIKRSPKGPRTSHPASSVTSCSHLWCCSVPPAHTIVLSDARIESASGAATNAAGGAAWKGARKPAHNAIGFGHVPSCCKCPTHWESLGGLESGKLLSLQRHCITKLSASVSGAQSIRFDFKRFIPYRRRCHCNSSRICHLEKKRRIEWPREL